MTLTPLLILFVECIRTGIAGTSGVDWRSQSLVDVENGFGKHRKLLGYAFFDTDHVERNKVTSFCECENRCSVQPWCRVASIVKEGNSLICRESPKDIIKLNVVQKNGAITFFRFREDLMQKQHYPASNGHFYWVPLKKSQRKDSKTKCKESQGNLLKPKSELEKTIAIDLLKDKWYKVPEYVLEMGVDIVIDDGIIDLENDEASLGMMPIYPTISPEDDIVALGWDPMNTSDYQDTDVYIHPMRSNEPHYFICRSWKTIPVY